jgi:hypothetical protein
VAAEARRVSRIGANPDLEQDPLLRALVHHPLGMLAC